MVAYLLIRKIAQLFLMMALGFGLVKLKVLKAEESVVLSRLCLYLLMPCVILNAFQVDYTESLRDGILFAFAVAVACYILLLVLDEVCKRALKMDVVERASVLYPNAANLIIPIVSSVLGPEWVVYTSAFVSVQQAFVWTQGVKMFSDDGAFQWKKVFQNINVIFICVGIVLLVTGLRLPPILSEVTESVGNMVGPVSMFVTGMLIAKMDRKRILSHKRIGLVVLLRMVAAPGVTLLLMKLSGAAALVENGSMILLVVFMACCSPSAATVTQFSQIYNKDAEYAGAINILTTLTCIVTMPAFVFLYELF